jgi:hypothetical protein
MGHDVNFDGNLLSALISWGQLIYIVVTVHSADALPDSLFFASLSP